MSEQNNITRLNVDELDSPIEDNADLILAYLEQLGVEYIFGVPGGAIEPLYNALARSERRGGIRAIIARHECAAAFMADGYFRETGKLGVVCSTTGPGATNLITGVATARVDKMAILVITAQTALDKWGTRALQDSSETATDTLGMFRHCTKFNAMISHPLQMEHKLISALMSALHSPKGPVHISIPADVLRARYRRPDPNLHLSFLKMRTSLEDKVAVEHLLDEVMQVDKVAILVGHGCGRAYAKIQELAECMNAPFISGPMGKRWVNERHPLYRGVYGYAGHQSARDLVDDPQIELFLAFGTTMAEMGVGAITQHEAHQKLIHVDSSIESFSRTPLARLHVCGHLDAVVNRLVNKVQQQSWRKNWPGVSVERKQNVLGSYYQLLEPDKCTSDASPIKPQRLMAHFSLRLTENTRIFIDTGNIWAWATHYLVTTSNSGQYRASMGYGSMAWSIGATIGSAMANPAAPHVCFVGDGAWLMSSHEIGVAVMHKLPIVFVILNDQAFGMIRYGQQLSGAESIGWQLNAVDFAMLAKAQGANGVLIESPQQLEAVDLDQLFKMQVPTVLDVRIDANEEPPMKVRVDNLRSEPPAPIGYQ